MARTPQFEPTQDVDEADAVRWDSMGVSSMDHHEPNRVVDHAEHGKLSMDAVDSLAAQDIHSHRGLEMTQVRLDLPSATVEFDNGLLGIPLRIKQRGDERHFS